MCLLTYSDTSSSFWFPCSWTILSRDRIASGSNLLSIPNPTLSTLWPTEAVGSYTFTGTYNWEGITAYLPPNDPRWLVVRFLFQNAEPGGPDEVISVFSWCPLDSQPTEEKELIIKRADWFKAMLGADRSSRVSRQRELEELLFEHDLEDRIRRLKYDQPEIKPIRSLSAGQNFSQRRKLWLET